MRRLPYIPSTLLFAFFTAYSLYGQSVPDTVMNGDVYEGRGDIVARIHIVLESGFHAREGSMVHAYIDPNAAQPSYGYHPVTGGLVEVAELPSQDRNYIKTTTMRAASDNEDSISQTARAVEIEYLDGFGNHEMGVLVKGSPNLKDLVGNVVSCDMGDRIVRQYLPFEADDNDGRWRPDVQSEIRQFYLSGLLGGRDTDSRPWADPMYDGSPLNRTAGENGVGSRWLGHGTRVRYRCNVSAKTHWKYNASDALVTVTYPVGSLFCEESIDEDGLIRRTYSDNTGVIVIEETEGREGRTLRTAYVYDCFGQLRCVVPPLAASPSDERLCFYYVYDRHGRVYEKTVPDHGTERYVYDKKNRPVLSQDATLLGFGEWAFTCYDVFGRPVMSGYLPSSLGRESLQTLFDEQSVTDEQWALQEPLYGYSGDSYPSALGLTAACVRSVSWYDGYGFTSLLNPGYGCPSYPSGEPVPFDTETKGLETGGLEKAGFPRTTVEMAHVSYYDTEGRLLCSVSDHHLGEKTTRLLKYNFNGQATEETIVHHINRTDSVMIRYRHTYDHTGRELQEFCKVDNDPEFMARAYEYNAVGDAVNIYLHSGNGGDQFSQKLRHHFNIRGWLTDVNNFRSPGTDLFAMRLAYENPDPVLSADSRFNGSISQFCTGGCFSTPYGYGFLYDGFDRLSESHYAEGTGLDRNEDAFYEDYDYDANGNVTTMNRKRDGMDIDQLFFSYHSGTNKIRSVHDQTRSPDGYPFNSGVYDYDACGNPLTDPSRRIDIIYNRLNKPERVLTSQSDWMRYSYSSSGVLLRKELHSLAVPGGRVTDYCGEFLYEDNELVCIFTPFGRITSMETANGTQWRTSYSLADHLGNVRVEFAAHGNGLPELLQQTDYYPFGYILRRNDYGGVRPNLRLYGGKELQDETLAGITLNWYDFEARMYDPLIGRFLTIDPLANNAPAWTPYNAMWGNPLRFVDPTGMWSTDHIEVKLNDDNTYTIVGGEVNADKNIYLVDDEGNYQAVIGEMFTEYSFHNDNGEPVIGARIDPNDFSGISFFNNEIKDIGLMEYMGNAKGGEPLDFKERGVLEEMSKEQKDQHRHRGVPFDGKIATARDIGNYAAGYVAGVHGISWKSARLAFDALETKQKVGFWQTVRHYPYNRVIEGQPTQQAQYKGYTQGQYTYISRKRK